MKYNFDKLTERRGTGSLKWDGEERDVLPFWVADMDFEVAPAITEALAERVKHSIFGYQHITDEYYQAIIDWFSTRHHLRIHRDWIIPTIGVVPAVSAILKAVTKRGDNVLLQTPAYNCFFPAIANNGCVLLNNPLINKNSHFTIDFEDLEVKAADPKTTALILCNPHNPTGRVWKREELVRIAEICVKHNVFIVADEIHCEFTSPGFTYTPFMSLPEHLTKRAAMACSPSKPFNIAGLQVANIVCPNAQYREKIQQAIFENEVDNINVMGHTALIAAYTQGGEWMDELNAYIWQNYQALCEFIHKELPLIVITPLEGTYLAWLNCKAYLQDGETSTEFAQRLWKKGRVRPAAGTIYGLGGEEYLRFNMACPKERLLEGLERIKSVLRHE